MNKLLNELLKPSGERTSNKFWGHPLAPECNYLELPRDSIEVPQGWIYMGTRRKLKRVASEIYEKEKEAFEEAEIVKSLVPDPEGWATDHAKAIADSHWKKYLRRL